MERRHEQEPQSDGWRSARYPVSPRVGQARCLTLLDYFDSISRSAS